MENSELCLSVLSSLSVSPSLNTCCSGGGGGDKSAASRMITLGDHIDAIIINDYTTRTQPKELEKEVPVKSMSNLLSQINSTSTPTLGQWLWDLLVGLVVKASTSRVEDPGFDSCLRPGDFSGSSYTSDLKIGTPVATLPGAWRYRVSAGTGWPGVSIL